MKTSLPVPRMDRNWLRRTYQTPWFTLEDLTSLSFSDGFCIPIAFCLTPSKPYSVLYKSLKILLLIETWEGTWKASLNCFFFFFLVLLVGPYLSLPWFLFSRITMQHLTQDLICTNLLVKTSVASGSLISIFHMNFLLLIKISDIGSLIHNFMFILGKCLEKS